MRSISRTITIALTALMIAAPVASAHVAHEPVGETAVTVMHGQYTPGSETPVSHPSGVTAETTTPAGQPTWPKNPQPIAPVQAADAPANDDGTDWVGFGLGIAAGLLCVTGIGALMRRSRRTQRTRVTA
jgi:hypothetical protein